MTGLIAFLVALLVLALAATAGAYVEAKRPTSRVGDVLYQILILIDLFLLSGLVVLGALYAASRYV